MQTILLEPRVLYEMWSDFSLVPKWQEHVVSVTKLSEKASHWVMGDPEDADAKRVEFNSLIVEDVSDKKIAWKTAEGKLEQSGSVSLRRLPAVHS